MNKVVQFCKVDSAQPVIEYLARALTQELADGRKVLWLVPGGSAIGVAVAVAQKLAGTDLQNLTVTLTDERFGPVGHPDSNWQQMCDAGFGLRGAQLSPVLSGKEQTETTALYGEELARLCNWADYRLGFFGMGPDGHTAGILPNSPAVDSDDWAASYSANFERITMTPRAIGALDEAVVYAMGEAKSRALRDLQQDLPLSQQPAQALKQVAKLTIFNDQTGDTL